MRNDSTLFFTSKSELCKLTLAFYITLSMLSSCNIEQTLNLSSNLVSEIIHTLSFIISQKGEKTAKLKEEIKELLLTLNQLIIEVTVVS